MEDNAMPTKSQSLSEVLQRHEALLGRPFRRVDQGLDPDDIVDYLETVGGSSEAAFERLEQFSAVQAAAERLTDWIAQAKQMAEDARAQTEAEARAEAARMVDEAARQAEEARKQAEAQALSDVARIVDEADLMARQLATEIKEQAETEARSEAASIVEEAGEKAVSMLEETAVDCLKSTEETKLSLVSLIDEVLEKSKTNIATRIQDTRDKVRQAAQDHQTGKASDGRVPSPEAGESPGADADSPESDETEDDPASASVEPTDDEDDGSVDEESSDEASSDEASSDEVSSEQSPEIPTAEAPAGDEDAGRGPADAGDDDVERLYSGQMTLEIPQSADALWVRQLRQRILKLSGLYIQAERPVEGNSGAVVMHLLLEEPMPLLTTLRSMPRVARVADASLARFEPWSDPDSVEPVLKLEFHDDD
jgi:hypothetical protein